MRNYNELKRVTLDTEKTWMIPPGTNKVIINHTPKKEIDEDFVSYGNGFVNRKTLGKLKDRSWLIRIGGK